MERKVAMYNETKHGEKSLHAPKTRILSLVPNIHSLLNATIPAHHDWAVFSLSCNKIIDHWSFTCYQIIRTFIYFSHCIFLYSDNFLSFCPLLLSDPKSIVIFSSFTLKLPSTFSSKMLPYPWQCPCCFAYLVLISNCLTFVMVTNP